jgi:Tfp pilus assembly protein PilF
MKSPPNRAHLRSRWLVPILLAAALAGMAAQTATPRAAQIHDHLRKAAADLKVNDPSAAVQEFDAVLALDPRNAEANANLGVIAFFRRDYRTAAGHLRAALAADPSLTKSEALLGICERRMGDRSAPSLLEKSFAGLKDKTLRVQVGLELADLAYQEGDLDRAAAVMRSLVDLDPDNIEILYMAQRVYYELADGTLNKLAVLAPGSARMQQVIAERLVNEGDLKEATQHYRQALAINPHLPGVHYELAEAILEAAPTDAQAQAAAEKELEIAVQQDGDSAGVECVYARIAFRRSDMKGAFTHYSRAFELDPGNAEAQLGLGRLLANMDKPREAVKYLRMAVESDPLNEQAHYRLATEYRLLQMKSESEKEFHLFQDIKDTKVRIATLYRQMNQKPPWHKDQMPDAEK